VNGIHVGGDPLIRQIVVFRRRFRCREAFFFQPGVICRLLERHRINFAPAGRLDLGKLAIERSQLG